MWSDADLDPRRTQGDPPWDDAVSAAREEGGLAASVGHVHALRTNRDRLPAEVPAGLCALFERSAALPPWADPAAIAAGQRLYAKHTAEIVVGLLCYGLPSGYGAPKVAAVLAGTGRLSSRGLVHQRLVETARLLVEVTRPGALDPRSAAAGVLACQRLRFTHALVRTHLLERAEPRWDVARLGVPINQEDQAGTILCFGLLPVLGLERLGLRPARAEVEGWLHMWRVIGWISGLHESLLPSERSGCEALWDTIARRNIAAHGPNPDGRALMGALLAWYDEVLPVYLRGVPPAMTRAFLGGALADTLGVSPPALSGRVAPTLLRGLFGEMPRTRAHDALQRFARSTLQALIDGRWPASPRKAGAR